MYLTVFALNPGQNLLPTELQYSDGFAQLAAHLLLEVNSDTGNTTLLWNSSSPENTIYYYKQQQ